MLALHRVPGHPHVPPLQLQLLLGYPQCRESWNTLAYTHFSFSYPAKVPSLHRAPGFFDLHPLQPQLSCQGTLCMESPEMTQAGTHFSFSCSAKRSSVPRAPEFPGLHPLQFQLPFRVSCRHRTFGQFGLHLLQL